MTLKHHSNMHSNFLDRHLGTVIMVSILFFGQIATYAVLQSRVNNLEDLIKDTVKQTEYKDVVRRTEFLEKELVPRGEHLLREAELNKRLDDIRDNVKDIRDRVEVIDNRQRGAK